MMKNFFCRRILTVCCFLAAVDGAIGHCQAAEPLSLQPGDHVCYIGNALADRMQHDGWLETYLHALHPKHQLTFRNLGFPGDELKTRPRSDNFGSPDQWLTKTQADVVFCFFGYNEAFRGESGLAGFRQDLAEIIDGMRGQQYNGRSAPRLVVFSPIAHENVRRPTLPDGSENNARLAMYTQAMQEVCRTKDVLFVDLFHPSLELYRQAQAPLTMNGIHLQPHGNQAIARVIAKALFPEQSLDGQTDERLEHLRQAVLDKNYHWFSRYRVVDEYNVFGGRSKLNWFGQSNFDVLQREMEIFDVMTANRDRRVWAVAQGHDFQVVDDNLPPLLEVQTNQPGPLEGGRYPYLGGVEAMDKMEVAEGMQVNLFASEEMFPRLINPVQMAVDTDSRLWASVWPSYPHWNPTEERKDALVILPDDNGDGVADECIVFADQLNSITGFEFWGGGVLVAAPPELWFLQDTDGDDRADVKVRMLQGLSSADTHHTANAMVIGPDGGLYWSRGVFHVTNMETPTKTFRSTASGVYRFDPRTFEFDFHFPIGPNPHGDVFDQWGYQFVNDGTGGSGSYVNIGKGIGNKPWFKKRVRPVPATGILSSSHFPERNNGNFLICNAIGVLGVLQHEVVYDGADIQAVEIEPILISSDPNFRPSDLEVGGDGALYISDWHNALIGHMQHNIRDPNRDHTHGRIYRVTYPARSLLTPVKMKGQPIAQVCQSFFARENGTRYRARLELSGRDTDQVVQEVDRFAASLDPHSTTERDEAQALLECLWVFEEHRVPNLNLLKTVFTADEPRVRAASIRTLGHWAGKVEDWQDTLMAAARDESALVRAEAVKAAVEFFGQPLAAEVVFEVATRPLDPELNTVIDYARGQLNVNQVVQDIINGRATLSPAAKAYILDHASVADLLKLERTADVYRAVLSHDTASLEQLRTALLGLSELENVSGLGVLLQLLHDADRDPQRRQSTENLARLLLEQPPDELAQVRRQLRDLATQGKSPAARQTCYAAWIQAEGSIDSALRLARQDENQLRDLLLAIPQVPSDQVRHGLYASLRPLVFELPDSGAGGEQPVRSAENGIQVDYYEPNPKDVAIETLDRLQPKATGIVPEIQMDVPQLQRRDAFALKFSGVLHIDREGKYTFTTDSDDGSRLYIDGQLVVDNDGLHGMAKKRGSLRLQPGAHQIVVTYFDNGGGDGLSVTWAGPGFKSQPIPGSRLTVEGSQSVQDLAIAALAAVPGYEAEKFRDLAQLMVAGRHQVSVVRALTQIDQQYWPEDQLQGVAASIAGYVSRIPARNRTGQAALEAMRLGDALAAQLPAEQARQLQATLADLEVAVIPIGTVPHRMIFDKERLVIQAGKPVEFVFSNTDQMPHNFAVVQPGALEEVGLLAEATARDKDAIERQYLPASDKILLGSRLLQPGETQALSFDAPTEPGIYPYVCTYPGHWRRMYGALYVVADLKAYLANPEQYLGDHPLVLKDELLKYNLRDTDWKFTELAELVDPLPQGRSFEVGRSVFRVANCVACHRLNDEGQVFGPDLTKLDTKKQNPHYLLQSLLEPSKDIEEKYQSHAFVLESGRVVSGMVLEETDDQVRIIVDPIAATEPLTVLKSEIDERRRLPNSIMPEGLLNRLSREEILDLIAYVYAQGDEKHELFHEHHH